MCSHVLQRHTGPLFTLKANVLPAIPVAIIVPMRSVRSVGIWQHGWYLLCRNSVIVITYCAKAFCNGPFYCLLNYYCPALTISYRALATDYRYIYTLASLINIPHGIIPPRRLTRRVPSFFTDFHTEHMAWLRQHVNVKELFRKRKVTCNHVGISPSRQIQIFLGFSDQAILTP